MSIFINWFELVCGCCFWCVLFYNSFEFIFFFYFFDCINLMCVFFQKFCFQYLDCLVNFKMKLEMIGICFFEQIIWFFYRFDIFIVVFWCVVLIGNLKGGCVDWFVEKCMVCCCGIFMFFCFNYKLNLFGVFLCIFEVFCSLVFYCFL